MLALLERFKQAALISPSDFYFAKLIADKQATYDFTLQQKNLAILLAALCHYSHRQGNTCLSFSKDLFNNLFLQDPETLAEVQQKIGHLSPENWQANLASHIAFSDQPLQKIAPMVFQFNALYFYRVWQDELTIANYLKSAVQKTQDLTTQSSEIFQILQEYYPTTDQPNWAKIAVATALKQQFCLISGGPGTGKTHTVARLLATLQRLRLQQGLPPLHIKLAAPTGKAASRLKESIGAALQVMNMSQLSELILTETPTTIHKLLEVRPFEDRTWFNEKNPLIVDILVIDEASMIDLSLMSKLIKALTPQTKLILLGDRDQLASVEAGAIIGELGQFIYSVDENIGYSAEFSEYLWQTTGEKLKISPNALPITDCLCALHVSHRFSEDSGIKRLAMAVNAGKGKASWRILQQNMTQDLQLYCFDQTEQKKAMDCLLQQAVRNYGDYLQKTLKYQQNMDTFALTEIFTAFKQVRFLTALRSGDFGVDGLNQQIAERLRQQGLVQFKQHLEWYEGKPIMIRENDSNTGLHNGDIGLCLGKKVWFEQDDGRFKAFSLNRMPNHETTFAMTVHKSQGSEFKHTFFVLPLTFSPVLSKELVYTAVTRAREKLTILGSERIWCDAVSHPIHRQSGLAKLLMQQ